MEVWLASDTLPFSYDCSVSVNYKTEFYPSCSRPHSSRSFELSFFFQDGQWVQFLSLGEKAVMEKKKLCEEESPTQNPILQSGHTSENM